MKTYFTSDLHLGHKNVLELCKRPFSSIAEHDCALINKHNSVVKDSDVVFDFGDVGFRCSPDYIANCLVKMVGKRIIILGNHDKALRQAYKRGLLDSLIKSGKLEIVGGAHAINDKTLTISKMITIDKQKIFCSHYAVRSWPNAFRGSWHLYGHSHGNLKGIFKSMDVGVDTNNFYPYSFEEIKERMDKIKVEFNESPN